MTVPQRETHMMMVMMAFRHLLANHPYTDREDTPHSTGEGPNTRQLTYHWEEPLDPNDDKDDSDGDGDDGMPPLVERPHLTDSDKDGSDGGYQYIWQFGDQPAWPTDKNHQTN